MLYNNSYKEIALQSRQPNYTEWCKVIFKNTISEKGVTEVNCLHVGDRFEFRGLFEDGSDIVCITSKEGSEGIVTIKGISFISRCEGILYILKIK